MANFQQEIPIKVQSECFVKPIYEIEAMKKPYHLGPADLIMLSIDPIQKGLLFSLDSTNMGTDQTTFLSSFLEKLKHSLSIALVHFYPLAGRFTTQKYVNENACSIFVEPNKGPGVRFIHATAREFTVSDVISSNDVTIVRSFFDLGEKCLNYDGLTKALLSIQVTEHLDGVFIGFSLNHSVVDGTSFVHFVNMFSHIFRNDDNVTSESKITEIPRVPIFNYRPWLSHDADNEDVTVLKFPVLDLEELMCRGYNPGPLRERIFHFSPSSMSKLKAKANQECENEHVLSSFQSLTAFVWRSITRVRNLAPDQQTSCFFAVGARGRLDPPISDDYFGSFLYIAQYDCKVEELLDNGMGWNAMNLQKLIKTQDGKSILDFYKEFAKAPLVIPRNLELHPLGENGVIMGGSARFDMYGSEFGFGRALAIRMGYGNKENGKITASPGCEGGGSVDLEICLRPHIMSALEADQEFMSFVS